MNSSQPETSWTVWYVCLLCVHVCPLKCVVQAIWIRNVEKVVEDARQSFQAGIPAPLPLLPPPPRLNHSQSTGLKRISTSAKDPTIRTLTSNVNPSVTTFAGAPQAPARARRATVGSNSCPNSAANSSRDPQTVPQGGIARPITPCLNAELGKGEFRTHKHRVSATNFLPL